MSTCTQHCVLNVLYSDGIFSSQVAVSMYECLSSRHSWEATVHQYGSNVNKLIHSIQYCLTMADPDQECWVSPKIRRSTIQSDVCTLPATACTSRTGPRSAKPHFRAVVALGPDAALDGQIRPAPLRPSRLEGCGVSPRFPGRGSLQQTSAHCCTSYRLQWLPRDCWNSISHGLLMSIVSLLFQRKLRLLHRWPTGLLLPCHGSGI